MIIFDLACTQNHPFEGWFQSAADYDSQLGRELIACPHCGSTAIRRVPSAPHLGKNGAANTPARAGTPAPAKPAKPTATDGETAGAAQIIEQLAQQILTTIVANSEDVGKEFAAEARKIHYQEAPQRAIRGQATDDDYEELRDEGIGVVRLPVIKKH